MTDGQREEQRQRQRRDLEPERAERARPQPGDLIDNVVRINVENVVWQVRGSTPILAALVDRGALTVVGAVYSLDTGKVAWLPGNHQTRAVAWREVRANGNAPQAGDGPPIRHLSPDAFLVVILVMDAVVRQDDPR